MDPNNLMTLDEAINHCKEKASELKQKDDCVQCALEHKQLAYWLEDYKRLLDKENSSNLS